jgi:BTB/POZ domain
MSSSVEGLFTLKIDKVSELLAKDKANTELERTKSYDRIYYATYGPFTLGEYKCEVRVCPISNRLDFYFCFLDNSDAFKKYGIIVLVQDHNSSSKWAIDHSIIPNQERNLGDFLAPVKISGPPMIYTTYFSEQDRQRYCKDDFLLVKFVLWVLLDDSRVEPAKPALQPQLPAHYQKPIQPKCSSSPPDFVSACTLLTGQFADIYFIVKEQVFPAHRAILAAHSSVFRSKLLALQADTNLNKLRISVEYMDPLIFKYLLHFIYTDSLPSDFEETTPPRSYHLMFIAAHRFEIEGLKSICEEKLTKTVTDTIAITLKLIEHHGCGVLKIAPKD